MNCKHCQSENVKRIRQVVFDTELNHRTINRYLCNNCGKIFISSVVVTEPTEEDENFLQQIGVKPKKRKKR